MAVLSENGVFFCPFYSLNYPFAYLSFFAWIEL